MFVQFIQGRVRDPEGFKRQYDRWRDELAPQAPGWLGSVAGVTDDGVGFLAARFESEEAARKNSDRPEQGQWWQQTEQVFEGPAEFTDCTDVELFREGGSDDADFVQVIRGRVTDLDAYRELMDEAGEDDEDGRADVIGGYVGLQPDGAYTQVVYFTSEEEARAGERAEAERGDEFYDRMVELHEEQPTYLDIREPWLASA